MDNTLLTADFVTKLCTAGPSYSYSTALPHLREPDRVEIFFELAQELAEPNSEEYATSFPIARTLFGNQAVATM